MALSIVNEHERDENIRFVEKTHTYFINGSSDGYISSTTLVHTLFPKFDADLVISKMMKSRNWSRSPYHGMSPEHIKKKWDDNRDFAARSGTLMHENLEKFYNKEEYESDSKEFDLFQEYVKDHENLVPFRTEWVIYDEISKVSGSIDMVYKDPNKEGCYIIADWKRSKEIKMDNRWASGNSPFTRHLDDCNYVHYSLQLSIYKYMLEKRYGVTITECFIVVLHPNQKTYNKLYILDLDKEVSDIMRFRSGKSSRKSIDIVKDRSGDKPVFNTKRLKF